MSNNSIIEEYFDKLPEIHKIAILRDILSRYENHLKSENKEPEQKKKLEFKPKVIKPNPNNSVVLYGEKFTNVGAIFKRYDIKASNGYNKFKRLKEKHPEKDRADLISMIVEDHLDKLDKKAKPKVIRRLKNDVQIH